ncbi:hypothetical protein BDZ89DRAFT_916260, partial [Hymenopellis radicata]
LGVTLLAVSKITAAGYSMMFRTTECRVYDCADKILGKIPVTGRLYRIETDVPTAMHGNDAPISVSLDDLHQMMGHISPDAAKRLVDMSTNHIVDGIILDEAQPAPTSCDSCEYGKKTRKAVAKISDHERAKELGATIHSDLWGPSPVQTPQHKEYYMSFTDDYS